jgi:hypothetical protein
VAADLETQEDEGCRAERNQNVRTQAGGFLHFLTFPADHATDQERGGEARRDFSDRRALSKPIQRFHRLALSKLRTA